MPIKCDVLVVGGGPAGSSAAYSASKSGAKTILIEKKDEITQVSCAEGMGAYLFPLLPFKIPKKQLIWGIDGISFSDGETEIIQKGHFYKGWSVERKNFDNWLLSLAENSGTKIMMGTELLDVEISKEYHVKKVIAKSKEKVITIEPTFLIAADGVESTVAKKIDVLKKHPKSIGNVYSWEMKNVSLKYPHLEQMYFGDFAQGGYAYIFPKSNDRANIGVGSTKEENLEKNFNYFLKEIIPSQVKNAVKTVDRSGKAPIDYIVPKWKYGNIIFTGDAANQNFKPYIEGILPSVICGDIAGKAASSDGKKDYETMIREKIGRQFKESDRLLKKLYEIDQIEGEKKNLLSIYLFAFMNTRELDKLSEKEIPVIKNELLRKSHHVNSFITMLKYFIWYSKVLATRRD